MGEWLLHVEAKRRFDDRNASNAKELRIAFRCHMVAARNIRDTPIVPLPTSFACSRCFVDNP